MIETMIWRERDGALDGELNVEINDAGAVRSSFVLSREGEAWRLCEPSASDQPCWLVAAGARGSLEGGRAFLDRYRDRLRIGVIAADGAERKIFEGAREVCPT